MKAVSIFLRALMLCVMFCALLSVWGGPVLAESTDDADQEKAREQAEKRVEAEMVKMNNLVEAMAKNLGQLHYLRTLCFGDSDQKWRIFAGTMMDYEASDSEDQRSKFVQAFNSGYYLEKDRHEVCSENVSLDVAALAENGRNIAAMLGDPYREN